MYAHLYVHHQEPPSEFARWAAAAVQRATSVHCFRQPLSAARGRPGRPRAPAAWPPAVLWFRAKGVWPLKAHRLLRGALVAGVLRLLGRQLQRKGARLHHEEVLPRLPLQGGQQSAVRGVTPTRCPA